MSNRVLARSIQLTVVAAILVNTGQGVAKSFGKVASMARSIPNAKGESTVETGRWLNFVLAISR